MLSRQSDTLLEVPEVKIDLQNSEGRHALFCASSYGHTQVVQLLISAYPNPQELINLPMKCGLTPTMAASCYGYTETISLLINNGADINMVEEAGHSALMLAIANGPHTEVALLLLKNGADVNIINSGLTPLIAASGSGHVQMVSLLLQNGADANMCIILGRFMLLLPKGADANNKTGCLLCFLQA